MVPAERLLVRGLHDAVDHPIRDPVRQRLHTMLIDGAVPRLALHLSLDRTRDGCQWVAIDVRRHGSTSLLSVRGAPPPYTRRQRLPCSRPAGPANAGPAPESRAPAREDMRKP